jgi:glycosyltransferase involved in cell wall biosynthesis
VSNGRLRALMVSRSYWPHLSSDVASRTLRLADGLARAGVQVDVLTPRYASSWPDRICHREIVVHRPAAAPRSEWSMGRYLRHVESWLREHSGQYDVLYSATMREEAAIVVESARRIGAASVLHHAGAGKEADTTYQAPIRHRRRLQSAIRSADAIVVSRASTHQTLISSGIHRDRIHRMATGVWPGKGLAGRDTVSRQQSRQCLAAVNGDLATDRDSLVVVSMNSMSESSGVLSLAQAIPPLIDIWPDLRFWLIGDGPMRNELHRYFKQFGVRQNVAMPGTFVDYSDVLGAADLFVQPSVSDAMEDFMPQAIAAPLPLVIADAADTRAMLGEFDDCVNWCTEGDSLSLTQAIRRAITDLGPAQTASERLRRELVLRRPYADTINGFLDLFSKLSGKPITHPSQPVGSQAGI